MLNIINLHAEVVEAEKKILKGLNLHVNAGEVHAIMGPNGTGKSTLANVVAGKESYKITEGKILFKGKDISTLLPEERAAEGIFIGFQYPVEIPGVSLASFMRQAVNDQRKYKGLNPLTTFEFQKLMEEKRKLVDLPDKLAGRNVNEHFSGGEKKRNEIFQMAMLEPTLAILDETDSGLDIDALRIVAKGINLLKNENTAVIVITHYQRLLEYIVPDFVHIMMDGKILKTGDKNLAFELEKEGYALLDEK
jgi:Fe-S cluster assembly ATP-binding protein